MSNNDWEKVEIGLNEMVDWETTKSVSGKLVDIQTEVGANNSNIYTLEQEDGSQISFWGSTVLDGRFKKVDLGTICKVEYTGMVESKNGRSYKNYEVYTKR